jgi:hypothetical protein
MLDRSQLAELSYEECLHFIMTNGTPEYVRLFSQTESISHRDMESILANDNLLPNEKIAFTTCFALLGDKQSEIFTRSGSCESQLIVDATICEEIFRGKVLLLSGGVIVAPISAPVAVVMAIDAYDAYQACMSRAGERYKDCKAKDIRPF